MENLSLSKKNSEIREIRNNLPDYPDSLYRGLPCLDWGEQYLLLSPYALEIALIKKSDIENLTVENILASRGFFGEPFSRPDAKLAKLTVILTNDCNLRCSYCYMNGGEGEIANLPVEQAIKAIDLAVKPNTDELRVSIFGGEATLRFGTIRQIVEYAKGLGIKLAFHISTNGVIKRNIAEYLVQERFLIGVSMDGTSEVNDIHRPTAGGKGSSEHVETTIRYFAYAGAHFLVRATITAGNVHEIGKAVDYWAYLGVKYLHLEPLNISGRAASSGMQRPDTEEYIECIRQILDKCDELGVYVLSSPFMNLLTPSRYYCSSVAGETFLPTPDLGISKCYEVQNLSHHYQEFLVGKLNTSSQEYALDIEKSKKLENLSIDHYYQCKNCYVKHLCGGICHIRNLSSTGSINHVDPFSCTTRKSLIKDAIVYIMNSVHTGRPSCVLGINAYEHYLSWLPSNGDIFLRDSKHWNGRNIGSQEVALDGVTIKILTFPLPKQVMASYLHSDNGLRIRRLKDRCESVF